MTDTVILHPGQFTRQAWKNGKGSTFQIAIFPDDGTLDHFGWRLSIAHITEDGPFSSFAGYDRSLVLIDGPGMILSMRTGTGPDRETRLTPERPIHVFPGEDACDCRLVGAATEDFNVMTRRGRHAHEVEIAQAMCRPLAIGKGERLFVFAIDCATVIGIDGTDHAIPRHALLAVSPDQKDRMLPVTLRDRCLMIRIRDL